MLKVVLGILLLLVIATIAITIHVEREAAYRLDALGGAGPLKALVLYHPSRDAHFSDELSLSVAQGLKSLGYSVDRATMAQATPAEPHPGPHQDVVIDRRSEYVRFSLDPSGRA
jgi:hypothetical protein